MNRAIIVRASIVLSVLILAILIPVGIEALTSNQKTPEISNPNDIYLTVDGIEITNGELWNTMKNIDGIDYLLDYTLEYLLRDELLAVTQEEIDAEIRLLTYLTEDEESILSIQEDAEIHQDYIDSFRQNLIVLGYDPDDQDSINEFVSLSIAKRNYTEQMYLDAAETDDEYISMDDTKDYYDATTYGDVCTLDIRFTNSTEITSVLKEFGLILNYEGGIGEYIGTTDINDVLQSDFNDTNTIELDADAVFNYYVDIYNFMNPWADQLPTTVTQEEYCTNYADLAVKNYNDMTEYKASTNPNVAYATYIFETLDLENENVVPFTYTNTKTFGDFYLLTFKVSQDDVTAFDDLTTQEQEDLRVELIELNVDETAINAAMDQLLLDSSFELFDPNMKLKYEFAEDITFDNKGSETLIATVDGMEITADDLFAYMDSRIGVFYSLETVKAELLLNSDDYVTLYGESHDYFKSNNDEMKAHVAQLDEMKSLFGTNYYANYGYSSANMTWDEFIYLAFSLETESAVIENMFVIPALQTEYIFDQIDYNDSVTYMQDQIDRYFSLKVNHLLIYLDHDFDFTPDDFVEYRDGLTGQDLIDFNALLLDYQNLILEKVIDDEMTLSEIVDEYSDTLMSDTTSVWAPFKAIGFVMKTEDLSEIDQVSAVQLDENFADSLKRIYDDFVDLDEETTYNDDQLTISQFGVHYIIATKGSAFIQHSALYVDTDNEGDPENDSMLPSLEQVELYLEIKYAEETGTNTLTMFHDDDVYAAVEYYYGTIYDAYMSQTAFGAEMGKYILDNNGSYTTDNTAKLAELQVLIDTLEVVNYPELFGE